MMEVDKREIKIKRHKDLTTKMILKNKNNNKRQREFSGAGGVGVSKFFLPEKRKLISIIHSCSHMLINSSNFQQQKNTGARRNRQKFLFGGNICDPLNLNSLQVRSFLLLNACNEL